MSSGRYRLTKGAKILIVIVILLAMIGGGVAGIMRGVIELPTNKIKANNTSVVELSTDENGNVINTDKSDEKTINLSVDEWIGYKSIIDANGGLTTQDGSIFDKNGINVNISIINDATQSSNALISGKLDAAGYTINRAAFLSQKFSEADFDVIMPFITNFSNGGDGIIATNEIQSIEDLVGAKVGVPQFGESHAMIVWFVNNSDVLTNDEKQDIIDNLIMFETADETAKAFFAGEIDVAATWEPYLSQATGMTSAHVLFSTKTASSLVVSGILFSQDFAEENPDIVSAFIDGVLKAADLYETDMNTITKVMPMFSTATEDDILANCASAKLATYADNIQLMSEDGNARTVYKNMCSVWESVGENVNRDLASTLFDTSYIESLADNYDSSDVTTVETVEITEENEQEIIDASALLTKRATVEFQISTALFSDSAAANKELNGFIEVAKVLDGAIIEIAGNCDPNPNSDPDDSMNQKLSLSRAETVKKYFVLNGIEADRIVVVGNGSKNPIVENDTEEHKAMNRRVDVSFKMIES